MCSFQIPFAFGWRKNTYKDTFALFISRFIYCHIYVPYFYSENSNTCIYKKPFEYQALVKQINKYKVFNIIVPHHYVAGLHYYIKENCEEDTHIFLVKNAKIQSLPKINPRLMYTILYLS